MTAPHIQKLLEDRYYLRDENGVLMEHTSQEMYDRVALAIAAAEEDSLIRELMYAKFYDLMVNNKFLPNTPTLINAGKKRPGSFSACFVIPVEDSMEGIFDAVKNAALIHKSGGGTGFSFSKLRESGALVASTGQQSSGPIEFMKVFNQAMDTVKQGGARRGASMGVLRVDHPNILDFIHVKDDGVTLTNFNLSVLISDEFMEAVIDDAPWDLISPISGDIVTTISSAKDVWDEIVEHAWRTGEPGLLFESTINFDNPFSEKIQATNPCGEVPLLEYESCNLGSINLAAYLFNDGVGMRVSWKELEDDVKTAVRFLDNVITVNPYPLPQIEEASKATRKIGLGVMGWADVLLKMHIPYDSEEALVLAGDIMATIRNAAFEASERLAKERGSFEKEVRKQNVPHIIRRNATLLCIAPTGTISRIAGVSSGIEPIFAWETHHNIGVEYDEVHWAWKIFEDGQEVVRPAWMKTAKEIDPSWHLKHQQVFQKYVDNSVSKTINLPENAKKSDVDSILFDAWNNGLKGITVYRDNSRANQPLNEIKSPTGVPEATKYVHSLSELDDTLVIDYSSVMYGNTYPRVPKEYRKRPAIVFGPTYKVDTGKGKMYVTVNYSHEENEPVEIFVRMGHKATGTEHELAEWSGRLLSLLLKYNAPIEAITRQSNKVLGDNAFFFDQHSFRSLPQLISYLVNMDFPTALEKMELEDGIIRFEADEELIESISQNAMGQQVIPADNEYCYECGTYSAIREGGCWVCQNCGDSKCG